MAAPIVKGMPYATMVYNKTKLALVDKNNNSDKNDDSRLVPTVAFELPMGDDVIVDGKDDESVWNKDDDGDNDRGSRVAWVHHELQVHIPASDLTWLVFVSERALVQQITDPIGGAYVLRILEFDDNESSKSNNIDQENFVLRVALAKTCSTGNDPIYCAQKQQQQPNFPTYYAGFHKDYADLLRRHAHIYPGPDAAFSFTSIAKKDNDSSGPDRSLLIFDWDAQTTGNPHPLAKGNEELLTLALPHHFDYLQPAQSGTTTRTPTPTQERCCWDSMSGWACTVKGSRWQLVESLPDVSFRAPRPPAAWAIANLTQSLVNDIQYRIPDNYQRGAGDTYFSGKMLARLARVLVIAEEVRELCAESSKDGTKQEYLDACAQSTSLTKEKIQAALSSLRQALDVWLDKQAEAPFVYDTSWGGAVSCGCSYDGQGCANKFPDCPAFSDPGLNFGNGFYNDMHFHYGYFIYTAAVIAHFDPDWGVKQYEKVLFLVRNIANPSRSDRFFPLLRHVDPFQGHSWASGIALPVYQNGRNQESSSEAIASYEAVALFGKTMSSIFKSIGETKNGKSAEAVLHVGQTILAMELRSTRLYWHLDQDQDFDLFQGYGHSVVGIMWQTMFQFQTWFGTSPNYVYGIQLLPLTPISEDRDDLAWIRRVYPALQTSCSEECVSSGWSIELLAVVATGGHAHEAFSEALKLPESVFDTPGGNGHSLSNTLWFLTTRRLIENPVSLVPAPTPPPTTTAAVIDCGKPETCTNQVLANMAGEYTCGARIRWLITTQRYSEADACHQVAGDEFPTECNGCF